MQSEWKRAGMQFLGRAYPDMHEARGLIPLTAKQKPVHLIERLQLLSLKKNSLNLIFVFEETLVRS